MKNQNYIRAMCRVVLAGACIVLTGLAATVYSQTQRIGVTINGEPVQFEGLGPQQIDGRTLVPVRGVLEKLGADVSYNPDTQVVVASNQSIDIKLTIGSRNAVVNSAPVTLDVPAQVINDHTFVPLRFLGESLGAEVRWDPVARMVRIHTRGGFPAIKGPAREERDLDRNRR